jgi:probable rRNA maturation factor
MTIIDVQNDAGYTLDEQQLRAAATEVLKRYDASSDRCLTIVITNNAEVAALNRQYRGIDVPTDVLSFPADQPPAALPDEPPYLGDLVIAYPYAAAQAKHAGHTFGDSLALLVVHGTLHLLGFDHDTPENRAKMWAAQEATLRALSISPEIVPTLEGEPTDDAT